MPVSLSGAPVMVTCTCTSSAVRAAVTETGLSAAVLAALDLSRGCASAGGRKLSGCLSLPLNAAANAARLLLLLLLLLL
jgi:hypothetical protein